MSLPIDAPLPIFYDRDGDVLDAGYIWLGTVNLNAETNPIPVFWSDGTPAPQPLRTVRGFIARNGAPAQLLVNTDYSIVVRDRDRQLILSVPSSVGLSGSSGSSLVGFIQAGTGAVTRTIQAKARETVSVADFGAVGNGVADDTAAIQLALNTGFNVYLNPGEYRISAALNLTVDGQHFYGDGINSKIVMTGSGYPGGIVVSGLEQCAVRDIWVQSNGVIASYSLDNAIFVTGNSTRCEVSGCTVTNHRAAGVMLLNASSCAVFNNEFSLSPVQDMDGNDEALCDIGVTFNSNRNRIYSNRCISGNAFGILVQSISATDTVDENVISGNIIQNAKGYGILCYIADPGAQARRNVIVGNNIRNTLGTILAIATGTYTFGCSIYLQNAEDCVVVGNVCDQSHSGGSIVTFTETLAPGAIGTTNQTRCTITGNTVTNSGQWGIYLADPNNEGSTFGGTVVSGNTIHTSVRSGIKVLRRGQVVISANEIDASTQRGISVENTSLEQGVTITGNRVSSCGGIGIGVDYANALMVNNNTIDSTATDGILVQNSADIQVNSNIVTAFTNRGIIVDSTNTKPMIVGNIVTGTGSSTQGINLGVAGMVRDNWVSGIASDANNYIGTFGSFTVLTDNSTTPAVSVGDRFLCSNTAATTITNFTGAQDGQEIVVVFTNGNTTLDFSGANLLGNNGVDRVMLTNDSIRATYRRAIGAWYVSITDA